MNNLYFWAENEFLQSVIRARVSHVVCSSTKKRKKVKFFKKDYQHFRIEKRIIKQKGYKFDNYW